MGYVESVRLTRTPNVAGPLGGDDLSFKLPESFGEQKLESYAPSSLAFTPGMEINDFSPKETVLVRGPSGGGKTTFLRALVNSIQASPSEQITHTKFNGAYNLGLVLKYAEVLDIYKIPYNVTGKSYDELDEALRKFPDLNSDKKVKDFVDRLAGILRQDPKTCLEKAVFVYEAGVHLINSGIASKAFEVHYKGGNPGAWYYSPEVSPIRKGSAGERNFIGLEMLFKSVRGEILCLDEPETSLDLEKRRLLEKMINDYEGQIFIATHNRDFFGKTIREISFNNYKN